MSPKFVRIIAGMIAFAFLMGILMTALPLFLHSR